MILTFYSNCILTKEYNDVVGKNHIENYLWTLRDTSITYTIDDVYLTRTGRFNVDQFSTEDEDIGGYLYVSEFKYNYFKLEDTTNKITRYFFIDDVSIVNGTAIIDYTEDIWSSYQNWQFARGSLSNCRFGSNYFKNSPKTLPENYISNKSLATKRITSDLISDAKNCRAIIELSYYVPTTSGVVPERKFVTCCIGSVNSAVPFDATYESLVYVLNQLIQYQATGRNLLVGSGTTYHSFDIINAYIIPTSYLTDANVVFDTSVYFRTYRSSSSTTENLIYLTKVTNGIYKKTLTLSADYKRYAVGTYDHIIPVKEDGKSLEVVYEFAVDYIKFGMTLKVGTSIIDISSSFMYEIPVNVQSADATQQQAISRQIKNLALDLNKQENIIKGTSNLAFSALKTGMGIGSLIGSQGLVGGNDIIGGAQGLVNTGLDMYFNQKQNDLNRYANNIESFTTSTAIRINSNSKINVYYGLIEFDVQPDNENYVEELLEITGYNVHLADHNFIANVLLSGYEDHNYNILRYDVAEIIGNLPSSILLIIKAILNKGFRIHFYD